MAAKLDRLKPKDNSTGLGIDSTYYMSADMPQDQFSNLLEVVDSESDCQSNPELLYREVGAADLVAAGLETARWTYWRCAENGLIWLSPRLTEAEIWRVYSGYRTHSASPVAGGYRTWSRSPSTVST